MSNAAAVNQTISKFKQEFVEGGDNAPYDNSEWELFNPSRKSISVLVNNGVRLVSKTAGKNNKKQHVFVCLCGKCGTVTTDDGRLKGTKIIIYENSTMYATKHIKNVHGIASEKTKTAAQNLATLNKKVSDAEPSASVEPCRYLEHLLAHLTARHGISFETWKDDAWTMFQRRSGGLECDIGLFKLIIAAQRERLSTGMVEVLILISLNKNLAEHDTQKVPKLSRDSWQDHIPKRPEFPPDYLEEVEEDSETLDQGAGSLSESDDEL